LAGYAPETAAIVIVIGMAKAIEAVSDIYHGLYQFHERLDYMAKSLMLGGLLALLLLAAVLVVSGSVLWAAAGLVVAQAARLAAYNVPSARSVLRRAGIASGPAIRASLMPHWDAGLLWQLALLTLPLGVMALLQSLNTNIPRFFIERDLGPHALGIFAALAYVMVAGTTIVRALGQAASPVMARLFNGRQWRRFFWHCGILMAAGIAIGLAGIGILGLRAVVRQHHGGGAFPLCGPVPRLLRDHRPPLPRPDGTGVDGRRPDAGAERLARSPRRIARGEPGLAVGGRGEGGGESGDPGPWRPGGCRGRGFGAACGRCALGMNETRCGLAASGA
jgi:hypothetical protein